MAMRDGSPFIGRRIEFEGGGRFKGEMELERWKSSPCFVRGQVGWRGGSVSMLRGDAATVDQLQEESPFSLENAGKYTWILLVVISHEVNDGAS